MGEAEARSPLPTAQLASRPHTVGADVGDRLDYMADLIDELRLMAEGHGLVTLAGLLAVARTEAEQSRLRAVGASAEAARRKGR